MPSWIALRRAWSFLLRLKQPQPRPNDFAGRCITAFADLALREYTEVVAKGE